MSLNVVYLHPEPEPVAQYPRLGAVHAPARRGDCAVGARAARR
jgi:hypothetical protein